MIAYYNVIWVVRGEKRIVYTHSAVVADELLEMLSQIKAMSGDIDAVWIQAVPEEVYF